MGPLSSDHVPICLNTHNNWNDGATPFKFFGEWMKHDQCVGLIQECWNTRIRGSPAFTFTKKLSNVKYTLRLWNKNVFGHIKTNIDKIKKNMEITNSRQNYFEKSSDLSNLSNELTKWYGIKEKFWKDKSRDQNLALGDRNTKYFHSIAKKRFRRNRIETLKDSEGNWLNSRQEIAACITGHFRSIATTVKPIIDKKMIDQIPNCITDNENGELCSIPTEGEIKKVLFSMEPDKSPGPDGFLPIFFQLNWETIGKDLVCLVQTFFINGFLAKELNTSFISLIPKTLNPTTATEFRPIALSNTSYKVISKLMANRMKGLLHKMISPFQSAFIPGRQISDNITIAHEIIHKMRKTRSKKGLMGIKIDMSKAFDRVEWDFLMEIMRKLGFSDKWCQLVYQCISSTSFSVLLNGSPTEFYKPTRGLRQGDPLSPYLFLICIESLSRTILKAESMGQIKGIKISRHAPPVSHLLFADDCIIFGKANAQTCHNLVKLLETSVFLLGS